MKILQIANRAPWPPDNGAALRPHHLLRALKARGDEVHVFGYTRPADLARAIEGSARMADSATVVAPGALRRWSGAARALLTGAPLSVGWFGHPGLARAIDHALRRVAPDAIVVHSANVAALLPRRWLARTWLDMTDVDSQKFADYARRAPMPMRLVHALEARRLRRYERELLEQVAGACLVTERERSLLAPALHPATRERLVAIPNGVDTAQFAPAAPGASGADALPPAEREHLVGTGPRLVFVGVMDYPPNADAAGWFARDILPRIRARHPQATFLIVGARPGAAVRALASLDGVRVTGFVEHAPPWFRAASVCVLPLRIARGIQNKALEAMACARPVVATRAVADGVAARDGEHLRVADDADAFAQAVCELLEHPERAAAMGERARAHTERHYAWPAQTDRMLTELDTRIAQAARP
jgi:sugar transferase (PEP-CTERM/EpsH1 system associated)